MRHCQGFSEFNGQIPAPKTVRTLVGGQTDLWYFQSPKNKRRFVLCGELLFLLAIAFEADRNILSYEPCESSGNESCTSHGGGHLRSRDAAGNIFNYLTVRIRNRSNSAPRRHMQPDVPGLSIITDEWLYERRILLDNWIFLCAAVNRVRHSPWHLEANAMRGMLLRTQGCSLADLLALPDIDPARMLGAVADAIQRGSADCDTANIQFTLSSLIRPGDSS